MSFSLSAGVNIIEKDFTTIVPAVSSSVGAFAGAFAWGPVLDPQIISSENDLVSAFGKPNVKNYTSFFSAANFLSYTNNLIVTRVDSTGRSAVAEPSGSVTGISITSQTSIYNDGYTATFNTSENGVTATAGIVLTGTTIDHYTLVSGGSGYDGVPIVTITNAVGDTAGAGATAHAVVTGGAVTSLVLDTPGSGYTIAPIISFTTNSGGVNAAYTTTIANGQVTGFVQGNTGSGYVTSTPVITITGGGGHSATASATINGSGVITQVSVVSAGAGYTSRPTVTLSGAGIGCVVNPAFLTATTIDHFTIINAGSGYREIPVLTVKDAQGNTVTQPVISVSASFTGVAGLHNAQVYQTSYDTGSLVYGEFAAKYPGSLGNAIGISIADSWNFNSLNTPWEFVNEFDAAPGTSSYTAGVSGLNDEMHIVIIDRTGALTGAPGTILEKFAFVSKAVDAKLPDGTNNYYKDVLNQRSKYVWWLDHPVTADMKDIPWLLNHAYSVNDQYSHSGTWYKVHTAYTSGGTFGSTDTLKATVIANPVNWGNTALTTNFMQLGVEFTYQFSAGTDGATVNTEYLLNDQNQQQAYALYQNAELWDISLVICGKMTSLSAKWMIENICETRKDCIAFCSPQHTAAMGGGPIIGDSSEEILDLVGYRTGIDGNVINAEGPLPSSSYGVCDSGYKYQYDRYNDKYWWIPLNADIAGLCARTDYTNDPWFSPGGFNRGQIKNVVKLAHNPNKTARDTLYKNGVNPVVSFPGQGVVLYGDKTLLAKPSAFDRINVRRLFIVLEKAIAAASKYSLFELNDTFTRAQFKSMVEPFLRDVQGRRGIIDFRVRCDESNNTGEVIDRNEFAGDIYIKPARSINYINLSFIAARTAVSFNEIGG